MTTVSLNLILAISMRYIFDEVPIDFYGSLSISIILLLANSYFQEQYSRKIYSMFKNMEILEREK
jgi:hypothetical protein